MIGVFQKNGEGQLCFAQPTSQEELKEIKAFFYSADNHVVAVHYKNGEEEMFTTEIASDFRYSFLNETTVLVVTFNNAGAVENEYSADLIRS